jgi:hypothetical protein
MSAVMEAEIKRWTARRKSALGPGNIQGKTTATVALEQSFITRDDTLGRVSAPFLLLSDNVLVFTSRHHARLVRS